MLATGRQRRRPQFLSIRGGLCQGWSLSWHGAASPGSGDPGERARRKLSFLQRASEATSHHLGHIPLARSVPLSPARPYQDGHSASRFEGGPVSERVGIFKIRIVLFPLRSIHLDDRFYAKVTPPDTAIRLKSRVKLMECHIMLCSTGFDSHCLLLAKCLKTDMRNNNYLGTF